MTMDDDLSKRSDQIHWPNGFDPSRAALFAHNQLTIQASCDKVWGQIIDARQWPDWYPNARKVQIVSGGDKLSNGTIFRWQTFGLDIESRVHEFVPSTRIGWYGYVPGTEPTFYHTWLLQPGDGACLVTMEEVGIGKDAARFRESDESLMHRGHDLWLATLKWMAEK